ncbi:WhiB family transcriptional regulator [Streptomyces africanus]|uniref:WhiB family transcriptional regulator n=1 Tax=Streptomyces africanus TaxID=231024 RepID=UPI000A3CD904
MSTTTRLATTPDTNWRDHALCAQTDPEMFFPQGNQHQIAQATEKAKKICGRCPARSDCLEWALDTGQNAGVWGGLSECERRTIARAPFSHKAVCLENRQLIEQRVAENVPYRQIAMELGVGHWAVRRAVESFRAQRAAGEVQPA